MDYKSQQQQQSIQINQPQQSGQAVIINAPHYDRDPLTLTCFNCRHTIITGIKKSPSAMCCSLFGAWALCCPGCQDVVHRCPNCNVILGMYNPGQDCC